MKMNLIRALTVAGMLAMTASVYAIILPIMFGFVKYNIPPIEGEGKKLLPRYLYTRRWTLRHFSSLYR